MKIDESERGFGFSHPTPFRSQADSSIDTARYPRPWIEASISAQYLRIRYFTFSEPEIPISSPISITATPYPKRVEKPSALRRASPSKALRVGASTFQDAEPRFPSTRSAPRSEHGKPDRSEAYNPSMAVGAKRRGAAIFEQARQRARPIPLKEKSRRDFSPRRSWPRSFGPYPPADIERSPTALKFLKTSIETRSYIGRQPLYRSNRQNSDPHSPPFLRTFDCDDRKRPRSMIGSRGKASTGTGPVEMIAFFSFFLSFFP